MAFFKKLMNMVKGVANDTLDAASDPGRDARQVVRDLEDQLDKANQAMLDVRAQNEVLKAKRAVAAADVDKWADAARKAMVAGDEGLARECLEKKVSAKGTMDAYQAQLDNFDPTVKHLQEQIASLQAKKEDLANRTDLIVARSEVADAEVKAATTLAGIGASSSAADFSKIEDSVLRREARAKAASGMADEKTGKSLEDRVAKLSKTGIDDELAALKADIVK